MSTFEEIVAREDFAVVDAKNLLDFAGGFVVVALFVTFSVAGLSSVEDEDAVVSGERGAFCLDAAVPGILRKSCLRFSISLSRVCRVLKVFSFSLVSWNLDSLGQ